MKTLFAAAAAILFTSPAIAGGIDDGASAIELHFVKTSGWSAVVCDTEELNDRSFVYCHPVLNTSVGGLFEVTERDGKPVVHPVTGKAKQYVNAESIEAMDGGRIAVEEWGGNPAEISALIDVFQS
ncbi:hypothetical protein SAMN06297251_102150 [Fulvimarina manganoxydans]|uniref:Uncharacterized protein n=1 Tax=Fulvimarina manganoxydans TaxID=937218 RepID=A0A1W1Z496_9HYPH|nr:hypothetical protein [Fulvimarina manganoxydans]SMC43275.1 hypothetical protein SAMN06297251_102150 [Fulvimarina manganoxydans]